MTEWFMVVVLKTTVLQWGTVGSNPTPSVREFVSIGEVPEWTIGPAC